MVNKKSKSVEFIKKEIIKAERKRIIKIIDEIKVKCGENIYMVSVRDLKEKIGK